MERTYITSSVDLRAGYRVTQRPMTLPYALAAYADLHGSLGQLVELRTYVERALEHQASPAQRRLLQRKLAALLTPAQQQVSGPSFTTTLPPWERGSIRMTHSRESFKARLEDPRDGEEERF